MKKEAFWKKLRRDFPVTRKWIYLDHAAAGPLARPVWEKIQRHYWDALHFGDVHWAGWLKKREAIRGKFAAFLQAEPEEVAFTASTSEGMNIAADLIARKGAVLTNTLEFPASTVPWLHRKVKVKFLKPEKGIVSVPAMCRALTPDIKTIVMSYVQYQNGFRQNMRALSKIKGSRFLVVNATQGFGAFPVRFKDWKADFLAVNSYKWFMAGYGGGLVCVKKKWLRELKPGYAGWRSVQDEERFDNRQTVLKKSASRYEIGCPPFLTIFSMGAQLDYLTEIGFENVTRRIVDLTDYAIEKLQAAGFTVTSPLAPEHRSGIVVFKVPDAAKTARQLLRKKIFVSPRGEGIRLAPHFYNNYADIDALLDALKTAAKHT